MTKVLGLLALLIVGCAFSNPPPKSPTPLPPGLAFQPQPVPLQEVHPPEYLPPPVLMEPEPEPDPEPAFRLPGPRLVGVLAVFEGEELLQCTEIYGFSALPFGPPEMETSGVRLVPIGNPCRVQFEGQFIPAMCGNKVSEEARKKSNLIWEQNYYFESLRENLGTLETNCGTEGGAWWDENKGGRYPDFLSVYPSPPQLEMF